MRYAPDTLIIDQTILCNQECGFCWRSDRDLVARETQAAAFHTMPFDLYREIVDQGARNGLARLSLCGPMGEPTLVRDLVERGLYARERGFFTLINTNGVSLNRHDPHGLNAAFSEVCVSLDASTPPTHELIHGKARQFERIVENVESLIGIVAGLRLRFTQTDQNRAEWADFVRRWRGRVPIVRKRVHSFIDVQDAGGGAADCNQPGGSVNYTFDGHMTTCCINYKRDPTFGHISEGMRECWEGEAFEAWRRDRLSGLCRDCSGLGRNGLEKINA